MKLLATGGKEIRYIRIENSTNTIHGHPNTESKHFKLLRQHMNGIDFRLEDFRLEDFRLGVDFAKKFGPYSSNAWSLYK